MFDSARKIIGAATDLCFPPSCLSCSKKLNHGVIRFCQECYEQLFFVRKPFCICCGRVFDVGENHYCSLCLRKQYFFTRARALLIYNDQAAAAIHSLKYKGRRESLATFAAFKKEASHLDLFDPDLIMPVPLHPRRLRQRGFNQALLLARVFYAEQYAKIDCHSLVRIHYTLAQTTLKGDERRKNVINKFCVTNSPKVKGKNVLIIDDVFTTGATVNECSRILMQAGVNEVQILTLARVRE